MPLAYTDPLVGPDGWKETGDLVKDNINLGLQEMEEVGVLTGLIWLKFRTCVRLFLH